MVWNGWTKFTSVLPLLCTRLYCAHALLYLFSTQPQFWLTFNWSDPRMSPKCCLMYIYITLPVLILCLIYVFMSTSWSIYLLSVMICFSLLFSFLFCLIIYRLIKMDTIFLFAHFIIFLRFSPRLLLSFRLIFFPIAACCSLLSRKFALDC